MITFLKLGGSLITDKTQRRAFRQDVMDRLAQEVRAALKQRPELPLLIGHGSGSFGHFEAKQYGTIDGVRTAEQWRGFASVAVAAAALSHHVVEALHQHGVPVFRVQPSALAIARNGIIDALDTTTIERSLERGLVPLVHGDVAFDTLRGGTIISTETIFLHLAMKLPVTRIILLGEVDGVYDQQRFVIPRISPANFGQIQTALGGSAGVDVTGGMLQKVQEMLKIATQPPHPVVEIASGLHEGRLQRLLLGEDVPRTTIALRH